MRGRLGRLTAVVLCGALGALACSGGSSSPGSAPADQQVLRINDVTEPNSYDPTQQTYGYEAALGRRTFEPLLLPRPDLGDVQPGAAQSYEVSADGLTYTFHLRPAARWSDGKPVVAQDWVYGFQHLLNPALGAGYADPFFDGTIAGGEQYGDTDVKSAAAVDTYLKGLGLSAPDDHTFVIRLQRPAGYFKWVVTLWVAVPLRRDVLERAAGGPFPSNDATRAEMWANDPRTIVGNGMFKLSEIVPKDHATVVPNPGYWAGPPRLRRITYFFISDANAALARYRTGELDYANVATLDVDSIRNDRKLGGQGRLYDELGTEWVEYNTRRPPLDDTEVRLALAKAIDRGQLATGVLHRTVSPLQTYIPKGMPGYDPSLGDAQRFDPAGARKLLQDAGVSPEQLGQLRLLTRSDTDARVVNQFISAQWKQNLGVDIPLEVVDSKTVTDRLRKGQFDISAVNAWFADYPDQQDWFDIFFSRACHSLNYGCPSLPGYEDLVRRADASRDEGERTRLYRQAQQQLLDTGAIGILYQGAEYDLVQPYVRGLIPTPLDDINIPGDLFFHDVYIARH